MNSSIPFGNASVRKSMHETPLFRSAALEAKCTPRYGEILLVRPVTLSFIAAVAAAIAVSLGLLFTYGTYTRRMTVDGVVVPDTGVVKILARQSGVISKRSVHEGQHVSKGMPLFDISTDLQTVNGNTAVALIGQAQDRRRSLEDEVKKRKELQQRERETLLSKIQSLRASLRELDSEITSQREHVSIAEEGLGRYQSLFAADYISKDQLQQAASTSLDQHARLLSLDRERQALVQSIATLKSELLGLDAKHANELAEMHRRILDVDQMLLEGEVRRQSVLVAPSSGIVGAVIAEEGQSVDVNRPVASIIPDGAQWQVHLFVPSIAAGFLHVGDSVRIRYHAYPYQKFGQYHATVAIIASTTSPPAELASTGMPGASDNRSGVEYYRVVATVDQQDVQAYGKRVPLRAGMSLQADIQQEHRRLYEWALEPLLSLTGTI